MVQTLVSNDLGMLLNLVKYEVNYVDNPDDQFTVPVVLTHERAEKLVNDASIRRVKFTPIFNGSVSSFSFAPENLIYTK